MEDKELREAVEKYKNLTINGWKVGEDIQPLLDLAIVKRKIIIDCDDCIYHQKFQKRKDEPSNEGCCHPDYAGYVGRVKMDKFGLKNCCGGKGFSAIGMSYRNFDGNYKGKE